MKLTLTISVGIETGWSLTIGAWNDPEQVWLPGFESAWDAWAFAVCNGLGDPSEGIDARFRQWTNKPPRLIEEQLSLFDEFAYDAEAVLYDLADHG